MRCRRPTTTDSMSMKMRVFGSVTHSTVANPKDRKTVQEKNKCPTQGHVVRPRTDCDKPRRVVGVSRLGRRRHHLQADGRGESAIF